MQTEYLAGFHLANMFKCGAALLSKHYREIDALNVFPVPDGDTGTNMKLTMQEGVKELEKHSYSDASSTALAFSRGLLYGARGNSGVILSQLFRGFSEMASGKQQIRAEDFVLALERGVHVAYETVMNPVEGTILTVAREAAVAARNALEYRTDLTEIMEVTLKAAQFALARTPEQLPILKEVGVVDSGGQGLVFVYEGFVQALHGHVATAAEPIVTNPVAGSTHAHFQTEDIQFGYCTEFFIRLKPDVNFSVEEFKAEMGKLGDSFLVAVDCDLVKVHIHAEYPGAVMTYSQQLGELIQIKIENMREQHTQLKELSKKKYGIIAVSAGSGFSSIFKSMGADVVVTGGQTMNPSTEELLNAASQVNAEHVIFLPNNKNIILAAEQASQLLSVPSIVVRSTSIPEGLSAILAFNENEGINDNLRTMSRALQAVKTGQVTQAVKNTRWLGQQISVGDFIGLTEGGIASCGTSLKEAVIHLVKHLISEDDSIVTLYYGQESNQEMASEIVGSLEHDFPEIEWEVQEGGQPMYPFLISVE